MIAMLVPSAITHASLVDKLFENKFYSLEFLHARNEYLI